MIVSCLSTLNVMVAFDAQYFSFPANEAVTVFSPNCLNDVVYSNIPSDVVKLTSVSPIIKVTI